ncbi:hypothetical protein GRF29_44g786946 [Pseudopithomyces chartarum]|uniref:N-acetyltransferase domain-containing protein n=1 Tax=Pseudopithomyces chartarum TaxID=1892770 RepID=A0AAN6RHT0_9PLEO|nr:hypothetical protein GRF29_44g786946 [Pseudopithomyces chartarum]
MSSISSVKVEMFQMADVSDEMLASAATLFSSSYGTWGPQAASKMDSSYKAGAPIKMSPAYIREQCLPPNTPSIHIRATLLDGSLAGYAFATTWTYLDRRVCWITQLCIARPLRSQGLATKILRHLRAGNRDHGYGILSSHPHAILAALRALGRGIEGGVHLQSVKMRLRGFMDESPVAEAINSAFR